MVCVSTRERFKLRIALSIESALVRFQSGSPLQVVHSQRLKSATQTCTRWNTCCISVCRVVAICVLGGTMYVIRASSIGILAICVAGLSSITLAQQVATTPAIRDVRPVAFPPYTANRRIALFAPTPGEYAQAAGDRAFV